MNYTVSLLTSKADCQAVINTAVADKDKQQHRKAGLEMTRGNANDIAAIIAADLNALTAEIAAEQSRFDSLPEGLAKRETLIRLNEAINDKLRLELRRDSYGGPALIDREHRIGCLEQTIAQTDAYILAVTNRMAVLP